MRELGAAPAGQPQHHSGGLRRLADTGYVTSRHGAGTLVADRPPHRRGAEALDGIVAEMLRRGALAGFTPDEVASAAYAAASERKRPGPLVRVLFAECTTADACYDADRMSRGVPRPDRGRGHAPRRDSRAARALPLRPRRHDHLPRRRGPGVRRRPGPGRGHARRTRLRGPGPRDRRPAAMAPGSVWSAPRISGPTTSPRPCACPAPRGRDRVRDDRRCRARSPGRCTADLILMSREALASGSTTGSAAPIACGRGSTSSTHPGWSSCGERSSTRRRPGGGRGRPARG